MEQFLLELEKMNDTQKEYMIFLLLFHIDDIDKRTKAYEFFQEKGFRVSKNFMLATMFNFLNRNNKLITDIDELNIANEQYQEILLKTKKLSQELNLKNSLKIANLFTYLLWNGYFSKDNSLIFQSHKRSMIANHYSLDIMNGIGVCLNFSDMLTDFINQFDYSATSIMNKFDQKAKNDYKPNIKRNIAEINFRQKILGKMLTPIGNKFGNHAFTLINENNKFYIYDATNLMIFDINNRFSCSNICGSGECIIKPYFSHYLIDSPKSEETLVGLNMNSAFDSPYSKNDFIVTWENCIEQFKINEKLLESFHEEIDTNIKNITSKTGKIKLLVKEKEKEYRKQIKNL